jgi:hypothetical protein
LPVPSENPIGWKSLNFLGIFCSIIGMLNRLLAVLTTLCSLFQSHR